MIEAQTKQIGECQYRVTPHGALQGRKVFVRIVNSIAPVIRAMRSEGDVEPDIAGAIADTLKGLSDEDFAWLCDEFAARTFVVHSDGRELMLSKIFDVHFAANYSNMIAWLVFALGVNFGGFFQDQALGDLLDTLMKKASP